MQQQQWELLFSLWSVPVMTSGNNRTTQQSKWSDHRLYNQANQLSGLTDRLVIGHKVTLTLTGVMDLVSDQLLVME
jgi:hypothetical protein